MKALHTANPFICAFLLIGLSDIHAQSQSEQISNAPSSEAKAYKTLNFGDSNETTEKKLKDVVVDGEKISTDPAFIEHSETFWKSLFDTDAEYEPFKFDKTHSSQSDKLTPLMRYFGEAVGVNVLCYHNDAITVSCYQLGIGLNTFHPRENGGLAVVEVSYTTFDLGKLVDGFMQNYPNAQKKNKPYKIESTVYPGVFLEFEETLFCDIKRDRRATLSVPTEKIAFTFIEPSKLSKEQSHVWEDLMTKDGKTSQMKEFFESTKNSFSELEKQINLEYKPTQNALLSGNPNHLRLDPLTYLGWYNNRDYEPIVYGPPNAVFVSKQILDSHMNNYRHSVEAKDQAEKDRIKKESESSSGF